jgi:hypothetical protein
MRYCTNVMVCAQIKQPLRELLLRTCGKQAYKQVVLTKITPLKKDLPQLQMLSLNWQAHTEHILEPRCHSSDYIFVASQGKMKIFTKF